MLGTVAAVPRVVLVNVQLNGSRDWESSVNGELASAAGRWGNVHLADWYGASAGHPDYFRDGIHLTAAGAEAYAAAIAAVF
jgi:lysophospholipase L1-like esterase